MRCEKHLAIIRDSERKRREAYITSKHAGADSLAPPKSGIAPFLNDPSLLPKRPPGK